MHTDQQHVLDTPAAPMTLPGATAPYNRQVGAGGSYETQDDSVGNPARDRPPRRLADWLAGRPTSGFTIDDMIEEILPRGFPPGISHVAYSDSWGAREFVSTAFAVERAKRDGVLVAVGTSLNGGHRPPWLVACDEFARAAAAVQRAVSSGVGVVFIDHIDVLLLRSAADPKGELWTFLRQVQSEAVARRASVVITTRLSFAQDGWRQPMRAPHGRTLSRAAALRLFVTGVPLKDITAFGLYRRAPSADTAGDWVRVEAWEGRRNPIVRSSDCVAPYRTEDSEEDE